MARSILTLALSIAIFLSIFAFSVSAHPGNTASDGCHYCRTNCDSWGVPWYERHCHGGYSVPPPAYDPTNTPIPYPTDTPIIYPTWTPKPKVTFTPVPTSTEIPPSPTEVPTDIPEPTAEVLGVQVGNTPTPLVASARTSNFAESLLKLLIIGTIAGVSSFFYKLSKTSLSPVNSSLQPVQESVIINKNSPLHGKGGENMEDGKKFCHKCGASIFSEAEICPKCGVRQHSGRLADKKNKIAAALFAMFLGGLGVHKFYLGRSGQGVIYLLLCWTFIPTIVGFIEGLVYLTMSESAFSAKYNK